MSVKTQVGLLFVVAAALLAGLTFMVEDSLSDIFSKGYVLKVRLKEAEVEQGSPVKLAGVKVGKVKNVVVSEKNKKPVEVTMQIDEGVAIYDTYVARVVLSSLIGKAALVIEMHYTPESKRLKSGATIPLTAETVSLDAVLVEARKAVEDVRTLTAKARAGEGTLGKLLASEEAYEEIRRALQSVRTTFENASTITAAIKDGNGAMARLINDPALGERVDGAVTEVRGAFANANTVLQDVKDGKGAVGRLMTDDGLGQRVDSAVTEFQGTFTNANFVLEQVKEGRGTAGKLLTDETLAQDVTQAVRHVKDTGNNLSDITGHVKKGEGNIGRLVYDEKLVTSAQQILDSIQAALEDLRESAPVASFAGAVLGAF